MITMNGAASRKARIKPVLVANVLGEAIHVADTANKIAKQVFGAVFMLLFWFGVRVLLLHTKIAGTHVLTGTPAHCF